MKYFSLIPIILLSACATNYQSNGLTGGFEDTELSPGYYRITFRGNGVTSRERVNEFALLRASDLMLSKGCKSFQVLNGKDSVNTSYVDLPRTTSTNANVYAYGNYATANATTTTYGGGLQSVHRAKTTLDARCINAEADPSQNIFDTNFINQKLKQKYRIN
ncbi:TPA: CC0125/CC1285 family lipoprotein [Acinetobacter baumannii]